MVTRETAYRIVLISLIGILILAACNFPSKAGMEAPTQPAPSSVTDASPSNPQGSSLSAPENRTYLPIISRSEAENSPSAVTTPAAAPASSDLFRDDFTNPKSGWDVRHDKDAITDYGNAEFVIFVGKTKATLWSKPNQNLTDVIIEVDTRETAGPDDNLYGIICRYQNPSNFYRLVISGNGYAGIVKRANGVVKVLSGPSLVRSPAVKQGHASNHLKAVCQGTQLKLFVNDILVAEAQDADFASGDVGLLASASKHPGVEIRFSHFVVQKP